MTNLSQKSQKLLSFLRNNYIEAGYMYSGSWPYARLKERGFDEDVIHELQEAGKIQRRDCEDYAFELSADERGALISVHGLASVWYEKKGDAILLDIQQEIEHSAAFPVDKDTGEITVSVYKVVGDHDKPNKAKVFSSFSVGQVISLEYDLPKNLRWTGYCCSNVRDGKSIGQFMVTNIVYNMLLDPQINMLEVQSLCDEFNKLYPRGRTMMVFEDILLKRIQDKAPSLSDQIMSASTRVDGSHSVGKQKEHDTGKVL